MRARSRFLYEHSLGMALSAIEVYNKPDFKERDQVFAILMTAAWEALLKARILQTNRNKMTSLYVRDGSSRRYKKKRNGEYFTIGIGEAIGRCDLSPVVAENILRLVDVRDAAIHLTAASPALPSLVFALGAASLRNYARLIKKWFNAALGDYDFYILPLGFQYPFRTLSVAEARREPATVGRVLEEVARAQHSGRDRDGEFFLVCEIQTTLVSAKKVTDSTDYVAVVSSAADATVVQRNVRPIDRYPYRFTELWPKLKSAIPGLRQNQVFDKIKGLGLKGNPRYTTYSYRSKAEEKRGPGPATQVLYNEDAYRLLLKELSR